MISWSKRLAREAPLLLETLAQVPSRRLLDLGCGTGEHARLLVEEGFEVVGVDRSRSMLEQARGRTRPANLRFIEGNIADIGELVDLEFGGAICLGNTLPHLGDKATLDRFFSGLRTRLLPGAPLILQLLNYQRIRHLEQRYLPLKFVDDGDREIVFLRLMQLADDGRVVFYPSTLQLDPSADPPLTVVAGKRVELRGWERPELEDRLSASGFQNLEVLGGLQGEAFDPHASNDLVLIAR